MSEFYIGQIMLTGFGFAQKGFAQANGQIMSISQNQALFSLIGTYYGGNGTTNFQLPNLQGRTPLGAGASADPSWQPTPYPVGATYGSEAVTLLYANLPQHTHVLAGSTQTAANNTMDAALWGQTSGSPPVSIYAAASAGSYVPLDPTSLDAVGGSTSHANMQPYQVINFNIALSGYFPSRG
jgi:microcystin-dependent protein